MVKIKKSLHKFLQDNLPSTFITYDSNFSDMKEITGLFSNVDLLGLDTFKLTDGYGDFQSDIDLTGSRLIYNDYVMNILSWDNVTSTVVLDSPVTENITVDDELKCGSDSLIYMKRLTSDNKNNTKLCFFGKSERWDLIVKYKNDSNKDKIDILTEQVDDLIIKNNTNIPIYEEDLVTVIGYMSINLNSYHTKEAIDNNDEIQSKLITFIVNYFRK